MEFSIFGNKLARNSGILSLMDDLGRPLPPGLPHFPLGGGNPARIPAVEKVYRRQMEELLKQADVFEESIGRYDSPQGRVSFLQAIAEFLQHEFGWAIGPENIAITNGSQSAFFYLFNLFSGSFAGNAASGGAPSKKTILFPLVPEYIGYADQGLERECFVTLPSRVELIGENEFKYRLDDEKVAAYLNAHPEVGGICVSRPTNPTGNVLTDEEVQVLARLAKKHSIPLLIDNAYGLPFPNIIFPDLIHRGQNSPSPQARPYWDENIVLSMSLSKIGLPSLRTGIVIANTEIISAISALNSIVALASGSLGQVLAEGLVRSGELQRLADTAVRPFYRERLRQAKENLPKSFARFPWRSHVSEGALFLWLYFEHLRIPSLELYHHLKKRGVIVVPGEYFFFGRSQGSPEETAWQRHSHREKCLRINYSGEPKLVRQGLEILGELAAEYML